MRSIFKYCSIYRNKPTGEGKKMELTAEQGKMAHAAATGSLAAQNERLREIIENALVELMNYEDRPTSFVIRDAVKELRRA